MQNNNVIEGYLGITADRKKSRVPARLDVIQSVTGFILAIFMIVHMLLVSSILISQDFMYKVTKVLEADFLGPLGGPWVVSIIAIIIIAIMVIHAFFAMRKFPINYRQFKILKTHKGLMKHGDTTMWVIQAATGFILFFTAAVHLYVMLTQPGSIGPNASSYRFVTENFWILYIVLLFTVELHGSIGLYRIAIKWGWFKSLGINGLKWIKWIITVVFIVLGLFTYGAYVKIGLGHMNPSSHGMEYYKTLDANTYGMTK
ncbi:fumarate reductase cytochrome b subunit [Helicobacter sp. 11S02629-2]|uniref:fumarate reductase cytochrome b subunit n=1 Tax=Helicobacter sp. 11S02629-2 TaxID=1476195 RepID=UPI000BA643F0|nr:fumarate reductase cytochrome b subunit [Helicobacter sp. 11S02629-2]PAF43513.1 succinate dehydrogenase/fumarate reductase cytochrome b subunit [Helicobacter sp. 11S02629-2]